MAQPIGLPHQRTVEAAEASLSPHDAYGTSGARDAHAAAPMLAMPPNQAVASSLAEYALPCEPLDAEDDASPSSSSMTLSSTSTSQEHVAIDCQGSSADSSSVDDEGRSDRLGATSVLRFSNIRYTVATRRQSATEEPRSVNTARSGSLSGRLSSFGSSLSSQLSFRQSGSRTILADINGCARSGEVTAIMGASGSGKTTLLNILGHRIASGSRSGSIELDGASVRGSQMQRLSAYVMQDDLMYPALTVRETLMFSAELRLPQDVSRAVKEAKVERLIELLGLAKVADSFIGDESTRGVSGGERKRVAIGVEIVCDPKILFLDEPTSGLDSSSAFRVVRAIRDLAAATNSISVMVLHQPSFRVLGLIHRLMMLASGHTVFHGPPAQLPAFLASFGCPVPQFANSTEFALDLVEELQASSRGVADLVAYASKYHELKALEEVEQDKEERLSLPCSTSADVSAAGTNDSGSSNKAFLAADGISSPPSTKTGDAPITTGFAARIIDLSNKALGCFRLQKDSSLSSASSSSSLESSSAPSDRPPRYGNSWTRELAVLSQRSALNILRTPALYLLRIALIGITGMLLATLFFDPEESAKGFKELLAFFVFVNCVLFFCSCDAVPLFIQDRNIFIRETSSNAYRPSTYMISSTLVYLPLHALMALLLVAENWWSLNLRGGVEGFLFMLVNCFVMLFTGNSIAICVSVVVNHVVLAYAVALSLMAYFALLSGFYIDRLSIPPLWIWLHYLSPMKYAYEAFVLNEFSRPNGPCYLVAGRMYDNTPLEPYVDGPLLDRAFSGLRSLLKETPFGSITTSTCLQDGPQLLGSVVVVDRFGRWENVGILLALGLAVRFATFLLLVRLRGCKKN